MGSAKIADSEVTYDRLEIDIECLPPLCISCTGEEWDQLLKDRYQTSDLILIHANVRDLRVADRLPNLEILVGSIKRKADVLVVSETWFRDAEEANCFQLPEFLNLSSCRRTRIGGGVSVFVHSSWVIRQHVSDCSENDEVQILRCFISRASIDVSIIAFYSRSTPCIDLLLHRLDKTLEAANEGTIILAGDANVNLLDEVASAKYTSFLASKGFVQCIAGVTRPASGTCLDHIWISQYPRSAHIQGGIIQTEALADHYPIFLSIKDLCGLAKATCFPSVRIRCPRRVFSSSNFCAFLHELQGLSWAHVLEQSCPDKALSCFLECTFKAYDNCFPVRLLNVHSNKYRTPWFCYSLRRARRFLDSLAKKARVTHSTALREELKSRRREYRWLVKLQFRRYHRRIGERIKEKPRQAWQHINSSIGRSRQKATIPTSLNLSGTRITGDAKLAEAFSDYFSNVGEDTVGHLLKNKFNPNILDDIYTDLPAFSLSPVTSEQVLVNAMHMKADFKGSLTEIPSKVYKQSMHLLLTPILHIFNLSIRTSVFPHDLKRTTCVPIYKGKGDSSHLASYRPISITPFLAKLFERCVKQQLESHLEACSFFSLNQFGFRRGRSTDMALCSMVNFISANCEGGNAVAGVFLDIAKAFDCISHELLLTLMNYYRFDEQCVSWFKSFLMDRKVIVRIGRTVSSARPFLLGVPQGSVLGPYLFIFYINSLLMLIRHKSVGVCATTYADDTTLLFRIDKEDPEASIKEVNAHISYVFSLFKSFFLAVNVAKTQIIIFKSHCSKIHVPADAIQVEGTPIAISNTATCLGLAFSADVKWKMHFSVVARKCYGVIAMLARLRQLGHRLSLLLTLYLTLFEPVLFYGASVWGMTYNNVINRFQVIQNDALRAIFGLRRRYSVRFVFKQHRILPVLQAVKYRIAISMFKRLNESSSAGSLSVSLAPSNSYQLRSASSGSIAQPFCRSTLRQQSPEISGPIIWNALPDDLKNCKKIGEFREKLITFLLCSCPD